MHMVIAWASGSELWKFQSLLKANGLNLANQGLLLLSLQAPQFNFCLTRIGALFQF